MAPRAHKGPTVKRQQACPCCGHWLNGQSALQARPVAWRDVEYGGRSCIRVVATTYVDELGEDATEFVGQVKVAVARLAEVLGLVVDREVVREVIRQVVCYRIPELFKRRMAEAQKGARAWAHHQANQGKRRGRDVTVRARTVHDAGGLQERWDGLEATVRRRQVSDAGTSMERW